MWQMAVAQYNISRCGSNRIEGDILARTVHLKPDMVRKGHSQLLELHFGSVWTASNSSVRKSILYI